MGLFRRHAQVSTVALQIYMVAGSYRCPILRAGGFRIDPRAFGSSLATMADASCMPGAAELSLFPEEEPPPQDVREWMTNALSILSDDGSALVTKTEPPSLLSYRSEQMPEALFANTVTGVTPLAVETRAAARLTVRDANARTIERRASRLRIMLHTLCRQIVDAVSPNAPLLARELNITCKQVVPFAELCDGCTAWDKIAAMSMTKTTYDERDWMQLVDPLPND